MTAIRKLTDDEIFLNALDANDRDTRIAVNIDARLYRAGKGHNNIVLENISVHGVQAVCDSPPFVGEAIVIELDQLGTFEGVVRWQRHYNFGVHIFEYLDLSVFSDQQ